MKAENQDLSWNAKLNSRNGLQSRLNSEITRRMLTAEGD